MRRLLRPAPAAALALLLAVASPAPAGLMLTPAGVADGLTLSTFASGFPDTGSGGLGPIGVNYPGVGVMVTDFANGDVYLFPSHADGQNAANVSKGPTNYGAGNPTDIAQVNGSFYLGTKAGNLVQIGPNGARLGTIVSGFGAMQDVRANPSNGHLIVSNQSGQIFDVDPVAKTKVLLATTPSGSADGLTVTSDGKTIYVADPPKAGIDAFDAKTGALLEKIAYGKIADIDGLSLGFGELAGDLFANTNLGDLYEVNLAQPSDAILLATGGSRGDFVSVDPLDASLLLTQTDRLVRVSAPAGSGFGDAPAPAVPEPSSLVLFALGGAGVAGWRWRRRKPAA